MFNAGTIAKSPWRYSIVAVGNSGAIYSTIDASTWTSRTSPITSSPLRQVIPGGRGFAIVSGNTPSSKIITTEDAITYSETGGTISNPDFILRGLAFDGDSTYVVPGLTFADLGMCYVSTDSLASWTAVTSTGDLAVLTAIYADSKFIVGNSNRRIAYSTSPASLWTASTVSVLASGEDINGIAYDGSTFVLVTNLGKIATSTDLSSWTLQTSPFGGTSINEIQYAGGQFIAVGAGGKISVSVDAVTWSSLKTTGTTNDLNSVTYGKLEGVYYYTCCGAGGVILVSSDSGDTWSSTTVGSNDLLSIAYGRAYV